VNKSVETAQIPTPPPILSTPETWERHLAYLRTLPDNIDKELAIRRAEWHLREAKHHQGRETSSRE
jgi:hypothetical protein